MRGLLVVVRPPKVDKKDKALSKSSNYHMVIVEVGLVAFMRRSWLLSGSQLHTLQVL